MRARHSSSPSLLHGPVAATLRRLTLPGVLSHLTLMIFIFADMYFVGLLGRTPLAALSFTIPIVTLVLTVALGLGIAQTALIGRALGRGDQRAADDQAEDGILVSLATIGLLAAVGVPTIRPLFVALGARGDVLADILAYMRPWWVAMVVLSIPMAGNAVLRGRGDMQTPLRTMLVLAVSNIVLDACLMFGWGPFPALGLAGAAYGTLLAGLLSAAYTVYALVLRAGPRRLRFAGVRLARLAASAKALLTQALPGVTITALPLIGATIVTSFVAAAGDAAVAAFAIGTRVELLTLAVPLAVGEATLAFAGHNASAGRPDRVRQCLTWSARTVALSGILVALALLPLAEPTVALFTDDPDVARHAAWYLWIVPAGYAAQGVAMVAGSYLLAIERAGAATVLVFVRALVVLVPVAYVGVQLGGLMGLFYGLATAKVIAGTVAWLLCRPRARANARPLQARASLGAA